MRSRQQDTDMERAEREGDSEKERDRTEEKTAEKRGKTDDRKRRGRLQDLQYFMPFELIDEMSSNPAEILLSQIMHR